MVWPQICLFKKEQSKKRKWIGGDKVRSQAIDFLTILFQDKAGFSSNWHLRFFIQPPTNENIIYRTPLHGIDNNLL